MSSVSCNYEKFTDCDAQDDSNQLPKMKSKKDLLNDGECEQFESAEKLDDSFQKNPFGFDKPFEEREQYLFDNVSQISINSANPQLGAKVNSQESLGEASFGFNKTQKEKEQFLYESLSQISNGSTSPRLGCKVNSQESLTGDVEQMLNETTATRDIIIISSKVADRYKRRSNELPQNQYLRLAEKTNIMERLEESEFRHRRRSSIVNLGQRLKKNVSKIFTNKSDRRKSQLQESLIVSPRRMDSTE